MTKKELIAAVQSHFETLTKKQVGEIVDALFDTMADGIKADAKYAHMGFGTFTVKTRAARKGHNPKTKEEIEIPESRNVTFKPAPELKNSIN